MSANLFPEEHPTSRGKEKSRRAELLAPAGSPEKLEYALAYGADAVYAGIPKFSLRARENQFKDASLKEAVQTVHQRGRKIYITANILPPNRKLESFKKSLAYFAEAEPDGIIMSDPGMIRFVAREFPGLPVHLSVQTNTVNWASVQFWHELGVRRTILSRELSVQEIGEIHDRVPEMELEAFVHGSICIAYSGRCLLSNFFNHRDANQGTCTNSCRWEYNVYNEKEKEGLPKASRVTLEGDYFLEEVTRPGEWMPVDEDDHGTYIMNSKDLRAIEFLKDLMGAGVISFKIEGRSKSVFYLSQITRTYRKALDDLVHTGSFDPALLKEVAKTANRGFTSAFLVPRPGHETERFDSPQEDQLPQIYAGKVVNERQGWMEVEVKNRIEVGNEIEYISPKRQYRFQIRAMESPSGAGVSTAHGGNGTIWISAEGPVEPFALLSLIQNPVSPPVDRDQPALSS